LRAAIHHHAQNGAHPWLVRYPSWPSAILPATLIEAPRAFFTQLSMPKVEGDPRSSDAAVAGADARQPSKAEATNVKPQAGLTTPDDVPPIHVLEAAVHQDRKETEDLLAGFDRPGRGPKKPSPERDFVDYYAKRKGGPESGRSPATPGGSLRPVGPRQINVSTVVKPRKTRGGAAWLGWAAAALLMLGIGGLVAFLATGETHPTSTGTPPSAATITAATPSQTTRDIIPPPGPPDPTTTTTTPMTVTEPVPVTDPPPPVTATGHRDPRGVPSAKIAPSTSAGSGSTTATAPSAARKPPPRDDFIRDL
jgi:hypothetical protein